MRNTIRWLGKALSLSSRQTNTARKLGSKGWFRHDRRGGVGVWFALTAPIMLMFVGAAIDYSNQSALQRQLQAAVDSAALAGASAMGNGQDAVATANQYMANNFKMSSTVAVTTNVTADTTTSSVKVTSAGSVSTYIMGILGYSALPLDATATAGAGASGPTEVAIVFDTTYSMSTMDSNGKTRLQNAQADAIQLVNKLFANPGGGVNPNVKVSLVPFGVYVNISTAAEQSLMAQGMSQTQAWAALTPSPWPRHRWRAGACRWCACLRPPRRRR